MATQFWRRAVSLSAISLLAFMVMAAAQPSTADLRAVVAAPTATASATSSNPASALLERIKRTNPAGYGTVQHIGARIVPTPDGRSFYVLWYPGIAAQRYPRSNLIVTLHGQGQSAIDEISAWYTTALKHNLGVLAVQWDLGEGGAYNAQEAYQTVAAVLADLRAKPRSVLLHGFDNGAALAYGVAYLDQRSATPFFSLIVANAGGAPVDSPISVDMASGGRTALAGTRWFLYCGLSDPQPEPFGCPAMRRTLAWLRLLGARIDSFIEADRAGHNSFEQNPAWLETAIGLFQRSQTPRS